MNNSRSDDVTQFVRACVVSFLLWSKRSIQSKMGVSSVSRMFQECLKSVLRLFQEFQEGFKHVFDSTVFQELGSTILLGPEKFPEWFILWLKTSKGTISGSSHEMIEMIQYYCCKNHVNSYQDFSLFLMCSNSPIFIINFFYLFPLPPLLLSLAWIR